MNNKKFVHALWMSTALAFLAEATLAQTPSPALLVLEKSDSMLAIVDPATLKIAGRVPAGPDPHEVVASPDGRFAYITNYGGGGRGALHTISVVDLATQKALPAVDLGVLRGPHGIDFADGRVYFTAEANKAIGRLDATGKQVEWLLGTGQNATHMVIVSKDTRRIFTSNIASDTITIIDSESGGGSGGWNETQVHVGKGPEGFDVSPNGKEVWAANSQDGSVSVIDVASKKVVQTIEAGTKHSNRLKFSPDGKLVLVSDAGASDLIILDAGSRSVKKKLTVGRGPEGVLIAPDGSHAYAATAQDNSVAVIDMKSLEVSGHIATGNGPDGLAWARRK